MLDKNRIEANINTVDLWMQVQREAYYNGPCVGLTGRCAGSYENTGVVALEVVRPEPTEHGNNLLVDINIHRPVKGTTRVGFPKLLRGLVRRQPIVPAT